MKFNMPFDIIVPHEDYNGLLMSLYETEEPGVYVARATRNLSKIGLKAENIFAKIRLDLRKDVMFHKTPHPMMAYDHLGVDEGSYGGYPILHFKPMTEQAVQSFYPEIWENHRNSKIGTFNPASQDSIAIPDNILDTLDDLLANV